MRAWIVFAALLAVTASLGDEIAFSVNTLEIAKPEFPGTPDFYEKEIDVLGIPVEGSGRVTEEAMRRAAEIVYAMISNDEVRHGVIRACSRFLERAVKRLRSDRVLTITGPPISHAVGTRSGSSGI